MYFPIRWSLSEQPELDNSFWSASNHPREERLQLMKYHSSLRDSRNPKGRFRNKRSYVHTFHRQGGSGYVSSGYLKPENHYSKAADAILKYF